MPFDLLILLLEDLSNYKVSAIVNCENVDSIANAPNGDGSATKLLEWSDHVATAKTNFDSREIRAFRNFLRWCPSVSNVYIDKFEALELENLSDVGGYVKKEDGNLIDN